MRRIRETMPFKNVKRFPVLFSDERVLPRDVRRLPPDRHVLRLLQPDPLRLVQRRIQGGVPEHCQARTHTVCSQIMNKHEKIASFPQKRRRQTSVNQLVVGRSALLSIMMEHWHAVARWGDRERRNPCCMMCRE